MPETMESSLLLLIIIGAVVTLVNRLAGHYVMARFEPIPFRVEAALEAVPVAVMITLVVPATIDGGVAEWISLALAILFSLRMPFVVAVFAALGVLLVLRNLGF